MGVVVVGLIPLVLELIMGLAQSILEALKVVYEILKSISLGLLIDYVIFVVPRKINTNRILA